MREWNIEKCRWENWPQWLYKLFVILKYVIINNFFWSTIFRPKLSAYFWNISVTWICLWLFIRTGLKKEKVINEYIYWILKTIFMNIHYKKTQLITQHIVVKVRFVLTATVGISYQFKYGAQIPTFHSNSYSVDVLI